MSDHASESQDGMSFYEPLLRVSGLPGTGWTEEYVGGTKCAEDGMIEDWARRVVALEEKLAATRGGPRMRASHAKVIAAPLASFRTLAVEEIDSSELAAAGYKRGLPTELCRGVLTLGKTYKDVWIRFSNASGEVGPDGAKDMRGAAIRIKMSDARVQDLLMTNMAASFARNPEQQVEVMELATHRLTMFPKLVAKFGLWDASRIMVTVLKAHRVDTLAAEQFWSRAPFRIGPFALKYMIAPAFRLAPIPCARDRGRDFLRQDLRERLARGSLNYDFRVQLFSDERKTPIEDATVEWKTPFITMGRLTLPQQDLDSSPMQHMEREIEELGFSPTNHNELIGIGSLNRARAAVYARGQHDRGAKNRTRCPMTTRLG